MLSKQDGTGIAAFDAETEAAIKKLGPGGHGLFENLEDTKRRGITPELVEQVADWAANTEESKKKNWPPTR